MFGFWDKRDDRKNPYVRPNDSRKETSSKPFSRPSSHKKSEVSERRTKVHVSEAGKELGKTTMVKKLHDSSGFWTEKEEGNKSTLRLKKENFKTREEEEHEGGQRHEGYAHGYAHESIDIKEISENVDNLSSGLDKLNDEVDIISLKVQNIDHLIVRLNLLEEQQKQILEKLELISKGFRCPCLSDNESSSSDNEEPSILKDPKLLATSELPESPIYTFVNSSNAEDLKGPEATTLETITHSKTITPEASPETTPETTPEASPEITPEMTPEITPEASPEAFPETITPEVVIPSETPETTPEVVTPETPETTPEVVVTSETIIPEAITPSETITPEAITPSETIIPEAITPEAITTIRAIEEVPIGVPIFSKTEKLPQLPAFKKLPPLFPLSK